MTQPTDQPPTVPGQPFYRPAQQHWVPLQPAPKKKHTARNVLLAALGAVLAICGIGAGIGALTGGSDPATTTGVIVSDTTGDPTPEATTEAATPAAAKPTAAAKKPTAAAKPAAPAVVAINDEDTPGLVGRDFPAGVYRVTQNVAGQDCYWKKSRDSEGSDIIDNDLPQGGRPQVTLKKGQWFTSESCGSWHKQ